MRFMLVGTGFAETHIGWIVQSGAATIDVLAYQRNEARARELAERHGIARVTNRPFDVIREGVVDAIAVVSPPHCWLRTDGWIIGQVLRCSCRRS